jgi:hypothetical protein
VGAALEPAGFSSDVSQRELQEVEGRFLQLELHCLCKNGRSLFFFFMSDIALPLQQQWLNY